MRNRIYLLMAAILWLALYVGLVRLSLTFLRQDKCLDGGGCWDSKGDQCVYEGEGPCAAILKQRAR